MNLNAREPPTELPVPKLNFRNKTQYLTGPTNPNKSKICFCCNRQKRLNADCFQAEAVKKHPTKTNVFVGKLAKWKITQRKWKINGNEKNWRKQIRYYSAKQQTTKKTRWGSKLTLRNLKQKSHDNYNNTPAISSIDVKKPGATVHWISLITREWKLWWFHQHNQTTN